jgi:hypothetical protein
LNAYVSASLLILNSSNMPNVDWDSALLTTVADCPVISHPATDAFVVELRGLPFPIGDGYLVGASRTSALTGLWLAYPISSIVPSKVPLVLSHDRDDKDGWLRASTLDGTLVWERRDLRPSSTSGLACSAGSRCIASADHAHILDARNGKTLRRLPAQWNLIGDVGGGMFAQSDGKSVELFDANGSSVQRLNVSDNAGYMRSFTGCVSGPNMLIGHQNDRDVYRLACFDIPTGKELFAIERRGRHFWLAPNDGAPGAFRVDEETAGVKRRVCIDVAGALSEDAAHHTDGAPTTWLASLAPPTLASVPCSVVVCGPRRTDEDSPMGRIARARGWDRTHKSTTSPNASPPRLDHEVARLLGRLLWLSGCDESQVSLSPDNVDRARRAFPNAPDNVVAAWLIASRYRPRLDKRLPWLPPELTPFGPAQTLKNDEAPERQRVLCWNGADLVIADRYQEDVRLEGPVALLHWLSTDVADRREALRKRWLEGEASAGGRLRGEDAAPAATVVLAGPVQSPIDERFVHPKFGEGIVLVRDGNKIEVRFGDGTVRRLAASVLTR